MAELNTTVDEILNEVDAAWLKLKDQVVQLIPEVQVYQHQYRDQPWLIVADHGQENYFRCAPDVAPFLYKLDGKNSIQQAYEACQTATNTVSHEDILVLFANLQSAGLLVSAERTGKAPGSWLNSLMKPFSIRIPVVDPDRFLLALLPVVRPLFSVPFFLLWLLVVFTGLVLSGLHWADLMDYGASRFADPLNFVWYIILYPLIKVLHELGHAFATRVWGGVVHEMGVMLLVFFPVPYVDSTAAHGFKRKRQRMLVSAAGIMVEIFLASLALMLWLNTDNVFLRDLAFDTMVIGGVSTLLFNANPLLRFDGYYLLSDAIEIPNLGSRANQYLAYLIKHYIISLPDAHSPVTARGERAWFVVYGLAAGIYRLFITLVIASWVSTQFFVLGLALGLWAILTQWCYPLIRNLYRLHRQAYDASKSFRYWAMISVIFMSVMLLLAMPVQHRSYAEGIVTVPEQSMIRAPADGIIRAINVSDQQQVVEGQRLMVLENPVLYKEREVMLARIEEMQSRYKSVILEDRTQSEIYATRLAALKESLIDIEYQIASLHMLAPVGGELSLIQASDLPGRYVRRGDLFGYITDIHDTRVVVVVDQTQINRIRESRQGIEVRLSGRLDHVLQGHLSLEKPQATNQLPSRYLGTAAGGHVAVDMRDSSGLKTMDNVFQLEVVLPQSANVYFGQRVHLHFIHGDRTVFDHILDYTHQLLLVFSALEI